MQIDVSVIIFTIFNALVLFWFLKKKLFVPVTNFMNSRTESIQNKINESEEMLKQAELLKAEYEKKISEAHNEGKKIIQEYRQKAENLSNEIIQEASNEAELIKLRVKKDAELEMERVNEEIRKQIISLALLAASKVVQNELDSKKHHMLLDQFITKVGM